MYIQIYATMETLREIYFDKLKDTQTTVVRYLMPQVYWTDKLFAIVGARGTGKTTLMLQYLKKNLDPQKAFYMSLDHIYFSTNRLFDTAKKLRQDGVTHLFVDEVHKYSFGTWAQELKNIYDAYPDFRITFSGSSILEIYRSNAGLSRRAVDYELYGLSFREFLQFEKVLHIKAFSLDELLSNHVKIAMKITKDIKILPLFRQYLKTGYYPYYKENLHNYSRRLLNTVNAVLETDLPAVDNIEFVSVQKLKRLLSIIAGLAPFTPNMTQLGGEVEIQRSNLPKNLERLERARLLGLLRAPGRKTNHMSKPEKIYLDNPNLAYALNEKNANIGTLCETFFFNQLRAVGEVTSAAKGDFTVDGKYIFEVGCSNKTFNQIACLPDSYLAVDDTEVGHGNRIPLWMFGLLY